MTGGHHPVSGLSVETGSGRQKYVLKATPADGPTTNSTEARLLRILSANTAIPVPAVVGVVDEHETLPAPFFLMERLPGTKYPRTEMAALGADAVATISRSAGRHLAELHRLDAVEAFGRVTIPHGVQLEGGPPPASFDQLTLDDPVIDWPTCIRAWGEQALEALSSGRFADLVPRARPALDARIDRIDGSFSSVLSHIDCSLDNLLVDPETHAVTGMLDWEFTVAGTPGYDLVYCAHSLAGGPWSLIASFPDYREPILDGLLTGYRDSAPDGALDEFREHGECYELLNLLHSMIHSADRLELDGATESQIEGAADQLRERAEMFL